VSKFTFFMWCVWICFLFSVASTILLPIAVIVLPLALIAVIAYVLV